MIYAVSIVAQLAPQATTNIYELPRRKHFVVSVETYSQHESFALTLRET